MDELKTMEKKIKDFVVPQWFKDKKAFKEKLDESQEKYNKWIIKERGLEEEGIEYGKLDFVEEIDTTQKKTEKVHIDNDDGFSSGEDDDFMDVGDD